MVEVSHGITLSLMSMTLLEGAVMTSIIAENLIDQYGVMTKSSWQDLLRNFVTPTITATWA